MIAFFAILVISAVLVTSVFGFIAWALREHVLAQKYRELLELTAKLKGAAPVEEAKPQFEVLYKEGRAAKSLVVDAESEEKAIAKFMKMGVRYSAIDGVNRK